MTANCRGPMGNDPSVRQVNRNEAKAVVCGFQVRKVGRRVDMNPLHQALHVRPLDKSAVEMPQAHFPIESCRGKDEFRAEACLLGRLNPLGPEENSIIKGMNGTLDFFYLLREKLMGLSQGEERFQSEMS